MNICTSAYSDKGGRLNNEDSHGCRRDGRSGVWVVADGLGGMAGGELASGFIVEYIKSSAPGLKDFKHDSLLQMMRDANRALVGEQAKREMRRGMRTTVVAAFWDKPTLTSMHFGDSRFYYFRQNELIHQSRDHSMSQVAVDLGEIELKDIRFHEDRSSVLKVLGCDEALQTKTPAFAKKTVPGDAFMLCTDGFWELIYEEEMAASLRSSGSPQIWLDNMLGILRKRLTASSDNYTAVCCMVKD
jgi:serine/threonine protein phosphatase PrpC